MRFLKVIVLSAIGFLPVMVMGTEYPGISTIKVPESFINRLTERVAVPIALRAPANEDFFRPSYEVTSYQDILSCGYKNMVESFTYNGSDQRTSALIEGFKVKPENQVIYYKIDRKSSSVFENAVYRALRKYEDYTNLEFLQTQDSCKSYIYFTEVDKAKKPEEDSILYTLSEGAFGETKYISNGRKVISITKSSTYSYDTWAYGAILHEVGHALGLKHSGAYQAADHGPFLSREEDYKENTIMSYHVRDFGSINDLGPLDKKALAELYGGNRYNSDMMVYSIRQ